MNFMQLLNSLDELLFEVMSWLVFFPVTLWRTLTQPLKMMEYADRELRDREDEQYADTLSPPLFLLLALFLSHGLELTFGHGANPVEADTSGLANLVNDDTSLLMLRLVIFSVIPLALAVSVVIAKKERLTRARLKAPFYAQCYPAAPFALLVGIAAILLQSDGPEMRAAALALLAAVATGYFALQTVWFRRHLASGLALALFYAGIGFGGGVVFATGIARLFA